MALRKTEKKKRESDDDSIWSNKFVPGFHPDGEGAWSRHAAAGNSPACKLVQPVRDVTVTILKRKASKHGLTDAELILRNQLELKKLHNKLSTADGAQREKILKDIDIKSNFVARLQAELDQ
jgi:hypothetical protein